MIQRTTDAARVRAALKRSRVVAILGPRQSGKTTLARQVVPPESLNYFDLEAPRSLARLEEPETTLRRLKGIVVIDEIHRRPDLFRLLRVLADRRPQPARFLILGSASPDLLRQSSETLAGRLETIPLEGFRMGTWERRRRSGIGYAAGFRCRSLHAPRPSRLSGAGSSCRRFSSAIFSNWV